MASPQNQQAKSFWLDHLEQWQSSGLSQAAYCRQHGLCQQKFSYRKRQAGFRVKNTETSTGFARVQVDSCLPPSVSGIGLSLRFSDGVSIEGITERNLALVQPLMPYYDDCCDETSCCLD